jgi:Na+-transporting methylmalonyl-CoA/oxaloacetate decarboxylase gamma subunit
VRYFIVILLLVGATQVMTKIVSDMVDREMSRQCVEYKERVQQIRKTVDGVSRVERNKVQYCAEWIYEGM